MYTGRHVLVTGGLGFIGSALAVRLVELQAKVTIVDSSVPGCGANPFNISQVEDRLDVIPADLSDPAHFTDAIQTSDVIFNIAGEISHSDSMRCPERDLRINTQAQLRFLLACRALRPGVRIVSAGTRQVYGRAPYLPVDEGLAPDPVDFNGIHKLAATHYHLMLSRMGDLDAIVLRLSNIYGPRMAVSLPHQGFLGNFLRLALEREALTVYGDGSALRDPLYIDDAIEAFLLAGSVVSPKSRLYNLGGREALSIGDIADVVTTAALSPPAIHMPFPAGQKAIDIGSYRSNCGRIRRDLGWTARTGFREGIERSLAYFREYRKHYLRSSESEPFVQTVGLRAGGARP